MGPLRVIKGQAYGNDFVLAQLGSVTGDASALARTLCDRHQGIGADGLILYDLLGENARMELFNADGSPSELSGNGLRCLAALIAREQGLKSGGQIIIETDAGAKTLELLQHEDQQYTFRAALGPPENLRQSAITVGATVVTASLLRIGNPQCVVLGSLPDWERFEELAPELSRHATFPEGTNVEFAQIEAPDRVRILIWERGVGPTMSSGTGASACAVAAAAHGGAAREIDVIAPGGTQRVAWREEGVFLTGWAQIVFEGEWLPQETL